MDATVHEPAATVEDLLASVGAEAEVAFSADDGYSGSALSRVSASGGASYVLKRFDREHDWIMRLTGDERCRAAMLWIEGYLDRVPASIEHAVVGAARDGDSYALLMHDVSEAMLPPSGVMPRATWSVLLRAAAELHAIFWGEELPDWMCSQHVRVGIFRPEVARALGTADGPAPRQLADGWDVFAQTVPRAVAEPVLALSEDPTPLIEAMCPGPMTLLHGDLKFGNLGVDGARAVMIDWSVVTVGHPAFDLAWFIALNATRCEGTRDELVDAFGVFLDEALGRRAGQAFWSHASHLGMLAGLVMMGWNKASDAVRAPRAEDRERESADLAWWVARAERALALL